MLASLSRWAMIHSGSRSEVSTNFVQSPEHVVVNDVDQLIAGLHLPSSWHPEVPIESGCLVLRDG